MGRQVSDSKDSHFGPNYGNRSCRRDFGIGDEIVLSGICKKVDDARKAAGLKKEQILLISFDANAIKDFNSKYKGYKSLWLYSVRFENGKYIPTSDEAVKSAGKLAP